MTHQEEYDYKREKELLNEEMAQIVKWLLKEKPLLKEEVTHKGGNDF